MNKQLHEVYQRLWASDFNRNIPHKSRYSHSLHGVQHAVQIISHYFRVINELLHHLFRVNTRFFRICIKSSHEASYHERDVRIEYVFSVTLECCGRSKRNTYIAISLAKIILLNELIIAFCSQDFILYLYNLFTMLQLKFFKIACEQRQKHFLIGFFTKHINLPDSFPFLDNN